MGWAWLSCLGVVVPVLSSWAAPGDYFVIEVEDAETRRGVPLVELSTVNAIRYWTDSAGRVAFHEPGWMGREVYFHVSSPGYDSPPDGFGYRGVRTVPRAGETMRISLQRTNLAERLYRITGEGIYRDTVLAGLRAPIREPVLNALVTGQDTVIATPYRGRLYWFWGDTDRVGYPLGNFGASGATSLLPGAGGLEPSVGIDLEYFVGSNGFARAMCAKPDHGLRWIESLITVPDGKGGEQLLARVAHHKDLGPALAWYLMRFDPVVGQFEILETWDTREGHDSSHPFRARVEGVEYIYLYPNYRVPADEASVRDLGRYEAFTCVVGEGSTNVHRNAEGGVEYRWERGAPRLHPGRVRSLVRAGSLRGDEVWLTLRDPDTGERAEAGRGSVSWNAYRGRWVMVGSGRPGEIWFAEADTPTGPWVFGRCVLTHGEYNFYNPVHHAFFDEAGGRVIYFEGTYTAAFSGAKTKTPRYDYNQIMYRLSLDDARLDLPVPVYRVGDGRGGWKLRTGEEVATSGGWGRVESVAFYALPARRGGVVSGGGRTGGAVPGEAGSSVRGGVGMIVRSGGEDGTERLSRRSPEALGAGEQPVFRVVDVEGSPGAEGGASKVGLFVYTAPDGRRMHGTSDDRMPAGYEREGEALGWVWRNPQRVLTLDRGVSPVSESMVGLERK